MRYLTDRKWILRAIHEYERLGRRRFLSMYGYGEARRYFLLHEQRYYDSKAIYGVAFKFDPRVGRPLRASEFSGGEETVAQALRSLGFFVIERDTYESNSSLALIDIVLVENEITVGNRYDSWMDVTGERYHFPNQYKNRVRPGRRFVYYRGVRRHDGRRGVAEYFGCGRIGDVYLDPEVPPHASARERKWFASIVDFVPFPHPVAARQNGKYFEQVTHNQWSVAVRELPPGVYDQIISRSGADRLVGARDVLKAAGSPRIGDVSPSKVPAGTSLLLPSSAGAAQYHGFAREGSLYSKAIGDRAEEIVFEFLRSTLPSRQLESLRWVAQMGARPGWDVEYVDETGALRAHEVKGTRGPKFVSCEMTDREWQAAKELRGRFSLSLVAMCLSSRPEVEFIEDPRGRAERGELEVRTTSWRVSKRP